MSRQSRIDYPGSLHHVIVRGIERNNIFETKEDKQDFLKRLGVVLSNTETPCYAYSLMSNHFHLLLQTGPTPISKVMQSLLTGYALSYNLRHGRVGKLYQNRFKSILCDKDEYFKQLIRYIHLNPMRVEMVNTLADLDKSPLTGHSIIMGKRKTQKNDRLPDCLDAHEVLGHFDRNRKKARESYRKFIKAGIGEKAAVDLSGGGLARSLGGYWNVLDAMKNPDRDDVISDERILGTDRFVTTALKHAEEQESKKSRLKRQGWDFDKVLKKTAKTTGVKPEELLYRSRGNSRSAGRSLLCKWLVDDLGYKQISVAEKLEISSAALSGLVRRGRDVEKNIGVSL